MRGRVALLVPTYNSAPTIAETLESLMAQGEILDLFKCLVIADDGSKDDTIAIVKRTWKSKLPLEIKVAPQNRGEATNVTDAALNLPAGVEWFFLMHSDNLAKEGWLLNILSELSQVGEKVCSVSSSWDVWIPNVSLVPGENKPEAPANRILGNRATVRDTLFQGCWWHHSTAAIRINALRNVGGYRKGFRQNTDWDLLIRLMTAGWEINYLPQSLMKYREFEGGVSHGNMLRHRDVWESLQIVQHHQWALTTMEIVKYHGVRIATLLRRMGSSLVKGQMKRFGLALGLLAKIPFYLAKCLAKRARGLDRTAPAPLKY